MKIFLYYLSHVLIWSAIIGLGIGISVAVALIPVYYMWEWLYG